MVSFSFCSSTSSTSLGAQLSIPPPSTNGQLSTPMKADPKIDLLSGDDLNALAIVPVGQQPQPTSPVASQHNALALVDMFSDTSNNQQLNSPRFQPQPQPQPLPFSYPNGNAPPQHEQPLYSQGSSSAWNGQITPQQEPSSSVYGTACFLHFIFTALKHQTLTQKREKTRKCLYHFISQRLMLVPILSKPSCINFIIRTMEGQDLDSPPML